MKVPMTPPPKVRPKKSPMKPPATRETILGGTGMDGITKEMKMTICGAMVKTRPTLRTVSVIFQSSTPVASPSPLLLTMLKVMVMVLTPTTIRTLSPTASVLLNPVQMIVGMAVKAVTENT